MPLKNNSAVQLTHNAVKKIAGNLAREKRKPKNTQHGKRIPKKMVYPING